MMFGNEKRNALKNSHQNSFVSTMFTRMVPIPQIGSFLGVGFFFPFVFCLGFFFGGGVCFSVTSISVFISYLFHFQVYHGKCTDFFVNVLGFAKKKKSTLLSLP